MNVLLFKWSENQNCFHEELKNMYYFFKDLYNIAPYLNDALDNLFFKIIIWPIYQTLSQKDESAKKQSCLILQSLFNAEVFFCKRLLISILILLFSPEIPKIQQFQLELNYLPTKDPELVDQCMRFFLNSQQDTRDVDKISALLQSITETISNFSYNSIFTQEIPKQNIYEDFLSFDYIQKLNSSILFKENFEILDQFICNYLNEEHYQYQQYQKHQQRIKLRTYYLSLKKNIYTQLIQYHV